MGLLSTLLATSFWIGYACSSNVQCHTAYTSPRPLIVPTRTITKTASSTWTTTVYNSTTTTTRSITNTYISLKGSVTTTIQTGPSFTPIISAPTSTSTANGKRTPDPPLAVRAATTKYPKSVDCTSTITRSVEVTATSTLTIILTTYPSKVITSAVPTQTVYAACTRDDNALTNFNGQTINFNLEGNVINYPCGSYYDGYMSPQYGINTTSQGIACLSQVQCCEVAQRSGYSGYGFFVQNGGHICLWTQGKYNFASLTNGFITPGNYGNGAAGSGTYLVFRG